MNLAPVSLYERAVHLGKQCVGRGKERGTHRGRRVGADACRHRGATNALILQQ
jgi:hypothetical protein